MNEPRSDKRLAPFIMRWRKAICAPASSLSSTERLVAFALAQYADADGGSCFPNIETIAGAAALSERATRGALQRIESAGYFTRIGTKGSGKGAGKDWRAYGYRLRMPDGPARGAGPKAEAAAPGAGASADGAAPGDNMVRHLATHGAAPGADYQERALPVEEHQGKALAQTAERSAPAVCIPLRDGSAFEITAELLMELAPNWKTADAIAELREARSWCLANLGRRKTQRGVRRFVRGWLQRARKGPSANKQPGQLAQNITDETKYFEAGVEVA